MFSNKRPDTAPKYVRLSVTDSCNFRCSYCLPNGCSPANTPQRLLSPTEIRHLLAAMTQQGVQKVRITGGEPGLRSDLPELVAIAANTPGIVWTSLTTNGTALFPNGKQNAAERAATLRDAGLRTINISLDSLDAETFTKISGSTHHRQVLESLDAALSVGFDSVKLNCVLMRDRNDSELDSWLELVRQRKVTVRFIELMPTQGSMNLYNSGYVSAMPIVIRLQQEGWQERPRSALDGPAREYFHSDYDGSIGVITPISDSFCSGCNRLRVTSNGRLHLCAFKGEGHPLRHLLASPMQHRDLVHAIGEFIAQKDHFCNAKSPEAIPFSRSFSTLGG